MIGFDRLHRLFGQAVMQHFPVIAEKYGCVLSKIADNEFALTCPKYSLRIHLIIEDDWQMVSTMIRPDPRLLPSHKRDEVNVLTLARVDHPEQDVGNRMLALDADSGVNVAAQARALLKYCDPMLRGDFSDWARIEAVEDGIVADALEEDRRGRERWVKRCRMRAQQAYDSGEFDRFLWNMAFVKRDGELTDEERRMVKCAEAEIRSGRCPDRRKETHSSQVW